MGRTEGAASTGAPARNGGRAGRAVRLPDRIGVACPPGTREAIERAAADAGMPVADYMRRMIRRDLDAARKRRERAAARP